MNRCF